MDNIGAEVGQKMRSAIKAKLLELNCYVDDELPDYIMVMVANKRSKSQMNEDLHLFLSTKTSTFVDWLHIVLKKLKEVTVTNPEVYKKVTKRKLSSELSDVKVKKEKKESSKSKKFSTTNNEESKYLTDDLPMNASQLTEHRRITIVSNNKVAENFDDGFDIPLLSEVNMSSEKDLEEIERKIRSVKSRLGLLVESDIEEELPEIKTEQDKMEYESKSMKIPSSRTVHLQQDYVESTSDNNNSNAITGESDGVSKATADNTTSEKRIEHKRITFSPEKEEEHPKKLSVLDRLGKKQDGKTRISLSEFRKEEEPFLQYSKDRDGRQTERDWRYRKDRKTERSKRDKERHRGSSRDKRRDRSSEGRSETWKEGILSRLGVMSKVSLPPRPPEEPEPEDELKTREVRSMVQVRPRVIPSGTPQPNTSLLLKAVAEAQKSIAQTPKVGSHLMAELFANKYAESGKEKLSEEVPLHRKFSQTEKTKLKNLILAQASQRTRQTEGNKIEEEYIPKPIKNVNKEAPNYVPSSRHVEEDSDLEDEEKLRHRLVVTMENAGKSKSHEDSRPSIKSRLDQKAIKPSIKSRLEGRKSPSPIIFDKVTTKVNGKSNIPDRLPIVHPPLSIKNKERCKYWPNCRQGDKCEFVHPTLSCEIFPHCKFGDKCLYLHPTCKFGSSCTKRDCQYSHAIAKLITSRMTPGGHPKLPLSGHQICKYFPNCTNISCTFFHPKPCKFGKYCKNQSDCSFSHIFATNKTSLTWRSK